MILLEVFLALICHGGVCHTDQIYVTREAMAIATCESGDAYNYGTYDFTARSATMDGGAWQFNDRTYEWLVGRSHAEEDTPQAQYNAFIRLWNNGKGWRHWSASKPCWDKWIVIDDDSRAVWR